MSKLDRLIRRCEEVAPHTLPICHTLQDFKKVVEGCFSKDLNPNIQSLMNMLKDSFLNLQEYGKEFDFNLTCTWKIHILFCHVAPFCLNVGCGLARYAEQTGEAIHEKFKPTWQRYKVDKNNPQHGKKLLAAVLNFSSCRR